MQNDKTISTNLGDMHHRNKTTFSANDPNLLIKNDNVALRIES